jgi:hypothetical protein
MPIPEIRTRWAEEQAEQLLAIPFISRTLAGTTLAGTDGTTPIASDHLQIVNVGVVIAPSVPARLRAKKGPNRSQGLFKGCAYCSRLPVCAHPPMTMQLLFCGSAPMQATACE